MLFLSRHDVAELLDLKTCISAVEQAFRLYGEGKAAAPSVMGVHVPGGGFHIKAGVLDLQRSYFAVKTNGNFPGNPARHSLPTIQGVLVLADAERGTPLAIIESGEITALRTAAATAVAVKYLARSDARTATIVGCGVQGAVHLRAVHLVRPLESAVACDSDAARAGTFARALAADLDIPIRVEGNVSAASRASDIVVTCTPSHTPLLGPDDVREGALVAGVGADHPEKQELAPALLAASTIVVDVLEQAATIGDLHHALAAGVVTRAAVYAELSEIVAGKKPGRRQPNERIVFDSTGMALQDVAAAASVYERAVAAGWGIPLPQ